MAADADDHRVCPCRRSADVEGQVLNENTNMLAMCRELGFTIAPDPSQRGVSLVKLDVCSSGARD